MLVIRLIYLQIMASDCNLQWPARKNERDKSLFAVDKKGSSLKWWQTVIWTANWKR
jgi:hypothetical protein